MIRIITENKKARADLENWLNSSLTGNMQRAIPKLLNRFLGDADDPERDPRFAPRIGIKDQVQGEKKDMYWWIRNSTPEEFAYFVRDFIPNSTKREFIKIFGHENWDILALPENKSKITGGRQSPDTWLYKYQNALARGEDKNTARNKLLALFKQMIEEDDLLSDETIEEVRQGSEIVCQRNGWTIVKVFTYPASEYYGRGSGWCTTGKYGNGQESFDKYMYHGHNNPSTGKFERCHFAKDGNPYYLMYFSPDGRKYNVLSYDIIYLGTGAKDYVVDELPDDVPMTIEEATKGDEFNPRGFTNKDITSKYSWGRQ